MGATSVGGRASVPSRRIKLIVPTDEYRSRPIPNFGKSVKLGECFVAVTDLPPELEDFMEVNPRSPKRSRSGRLSGPVVEGIRDTLLDSPALMAVKSIGIFVLVEDAEFNRLPGGAGELTMVLSDPVWHGIVNGGHTYLTIREAVEEASEEEEDVLRKAFVRLHIYQGVDEKAIAAMADGLNRSKQVDDPSLQNLAGLFDEIKKVMRGQLGEEAISYHQGDDGSVYITEVLTAMELFNCGRFSETEHPNRLFSSNKLPVKYFEEDVNDQNGPAPLGLVVPRLPEILQLGDRIREMTPDACKRTGFEFGRMKASSRQKARAKSPVNLNIPLPFLGKTMNGRVPKGWVLPMLAAFRANVDWNLKKGKFSWKLPLEEVLSGVIDDMVRICWRAHEDNKSRPEFVGKTELAYSQCYDKVVIYLAKKGKLS